MKQTTSINKQTNDDDGSKNTLYASKAVKSEKKHMVNR